MTLDTFELLILFPKQFHLTTLGVLSSGLVKVDSNLPLKFLPTGRTDAGLALHRVLDGGEGLPAGDWRHTWTGTDQFYLQYNPS